MENEPEKQEGAHRPVDELEEGELEEGELEDEVIEDNATKSPSPRTTPSVTRAGGYQSVETLRYGGIPNECAERHNSVALTVALTTRAHAQARDATTAAGRADQLPVRAPPSEPRALRGAPSAALRTQRQSSTGHVGIELSAPHAPRYAAPPTGPSQDDDGYSAGQRRHAIPHRDAPAPKRKRLPEVMNTVPDAQGNKILRLETLVREKEKQIDDLQWALAEAQAQFHIYKTRGPDHFDVNLNEHIKRKYWKRNNPDRAKDNWRLDELSDISDEESPRSSTGPPSRPAAAGHEPMTNDNGNSDASPGVIYTVYDELDEGTDTPCAFDDDRDTNDAAANMDMVAGANALRRRINALSDANRVDEPSSAAQQLARQELLEKTAIVQYGLRFSYTLSLWQEDGNWVPAPLGRFGQPYWKGSAWEDFDPRRIFIKDGAERVALDSKQFLQLAQDAARIAFVYRSATQRQVVSLALQNKLGLINAHEPDMVSLCRTNPGRVPVAIRRHYRRNALKNIFYTEYDAADISNHIILSLCGPQKTQDGITRRDYHDQRRAWLQAVEIFILDWLPLFASRLADPETLGEDIVPWPVEINLVHRRAKDDELYTKMWTHLTRNGVPRRCLLPGGDFHDYIRRGRIMEAERRRLSTAFDEIWGQGAVSQEQKRVWVGDRLPYEPVPEGFPVLRVKMGVETRKRLATKYRERCNHQGFIPV